MKRIGNSKEPTIQRMLNMTFNLREKFKCFTSIDLHVHQYNDFSSKTSYWISVESGAITEYIDTWPEVVMRYRRLMRKGK